MPKIVKISNSTNSIIMLPKKYGALRPGETKLVEKADLETIEFLRLFEKNFIVKGNKPTKVIEKSGGPIVHSLKKSEKTIKNGNNVKRIKRVGSGESESIESGIDSGYDEETGIQFVDLNNSGSRANSNVKRKQK